VSNLIVKDRYGIPRDVVAGFDNATYYGIDKQHPHFGGVPGRYANRIKNSSFVLDGETFHIAPNENPTKANPEGIDTLHGGPDGWDWRNFTVVAHTDSSVTFSIVDPDGKEGFPGEVVSFVTYTVEGLNWEIKMVAIPTTKKTPIMLSSHTYWNLDGFANNGTGTVFDHTFHLPYAGSRVDVDSILIPTGDMLSNEKGSVNDWWSTPKAIGANFSSPNLPGNCGFNCTGYGK
jgi:aldose 1-epimerase